MINTNWPDSVRYAGVTVKAETETEEYAIDKWEDNSEELAKYIVVVQFNSESK